MVFSAGDYLLDEKIIQSESKGIAHTPLFLIKSAKIRTTYHIRKDIDFPGEEIVFLFETFVLLFQFTQSTASFTCSYCGCSRRYTC